MQPFWAFYLPFPPQIEDKELVVVPIQEFPKKERIFSFPIFL